MMKIQRETWIIIALLLVVIISCMFMGSNVYEGAEMMVSNGQVSSTNPNPAPQPGPPIYSTPNGPPINGPQPGPPIYSTPNGPPINRPQPGPPINGPPPGSNNPPYSYPKNKKSPLISK